MERMEWWKDEAWLLSVLKNYMVINIFIDKEVEQYTITHTTLYATINDSWRNCGWIISCEGNHVKTTLGSFILIGDGQIVHK